MNIKTLEINSIFPYEKNPRNNEKAIDKVAESIKQFGFKVPIVIDKNNIIVAGHTRFYAAMKLQFDRVPCIVADDLTDEQVRAFRLADNKVSEFSEWDFDLLAEELDALEDWDMSEFGFEFEESLNTPDEPQEDNYEVELPEEPKAKLGDVYKLGNHRLMCGDSTSITDVEKLMNGEKADMVFTDPPYGMNLDTDYSSMKNNLDFAKEKNFTGGKKYAQGIVDDFKPEMLTTIFACFDNVKELFLWGADYFAELLPNKNDGSWIVWDKRANGNDDIKQDLSSDKMYGSCFELCWSKNKHKRDIARIKWAGVFGTEKEFDHKRYHPTQKPTALGQWFLDRYSKENQNIVDLFGGSGSTLIACEQLNRKCYMMELDPKYVDVIIDRWEKLTGKKAELIKD